ncbi:PLP-dependent aminotransferase family protein [Vibrio sp. 05-20-BW147]|nr:PLP-dependent aminotransferase family protein [Vibrio sp. 05-20-BW147]
MEKGLTMLPIEIGDLTLTPKTGVLQQDLYNAIREKITRGLWNKQGRLPATRKLAQALNVSRNTVIAAYEQLSAEGYIESRVGAGYYVTVELPEHYLGEMATSPAQEKRMAAFAAEPEPIKINRAFAPGVPDLEKFPLHEWQKYVQRQHSRRTILGNQIVKGDYALRCALVDYLASSRSVKCQAEQIIITSGAQQALTIALMCAKEASDPLLMEQPGYSQMRKVARLLGMPMEPLNVAVRSGIEVADVLASECRFVYLTPSNQYPMGTTLSTEQRVQIIEWARVKQRWIIEDDYDSEFQFAHRPYTSLQGLASQIGASDRVMYIGSFSKIMFNGLRLGYLVLPLELVDRGCEIKDALSGDSPTHTQAALAEFIADGALMRHIRKMRRLYTQKYQTMVASIERHFSQRLEVISQAAGLHVTVRWFQGPSEHQWAAAALSQGIVIRPLSYYESEACAPRDWQGAVLGFGNVAEEEIDAKLALLASLFVQISSHQ